MISFEYINKIYIIQKRWFHLSENVQTTEEIVKTTKDVCSYDLSLNPMLHTRERVSTDLTFIPERIVNTAGWFTVGNPSSRSIFSIAGIRQCFTSAKLWDFRSDWTQCTNMRWKCCYLIRIFAVVSVSSQYSWHVYVEVSCWMVFLLYMSNKSLEMIFGIVWAKSIFEMMNSCGGFNVPLYLLLC